MKSAVSFAFLSAVFVMPCWIMLPFIRCAVHDRQRGFLLLCWCQPLWVEHRPCNQLHRMAGTAFIEMATLPESCFSPFFCWGNSSFISLSRSFSLLTAAEFPLQAGPQSAGKSSTNHGAVQQRHTSTCGSLSVITRLLFLLILLCLLLL